MLGMLVKVLRGDSIATRRRLAREGNVAFEDLMRATSNFDVRTVTIKDLASVRYLLPTTVGIITVKATMRSAGLSWSHDTCRIDGEIASLSNEIIFEPLPGGGRRCRTAFMYQPKARWRRHPRWRRLYLQQVFGAMPHRSGSHRRPGHVVTVTRLGRATPLPLEHPNRDHLQGVQRASEITRVVLSRGSACRDRAWRGGACVPGARPRTVFFDRCCRTPSTTAGCDLSGGR
jgi:hypothetical protein